MESESEHTRQVSAQRDALAADALAQRFVAAGIDRDFAATVLAPTHAARVPFTADHRLDAEALDALAAEIAEDVPGKWKGEGGSPGRPGRPGAYDPADEGRRRGQAQRRMRPDHPDNNAFR